MPRSEVADEVDVVRLAVVHGMEVIVAVDRVQSGVVGELLFCDGWVVLKAKDGSDVVLSFEGGQFAPVAKSIRYYQVVLFSNLDIPFFSDARVLAAFRTV